MALIGSTLVAESAKAAATPTYSISGTVSLGTVANHAGAGDVMVAVAYFTGTVISPVYTDAAGAYTLQGLPAGSYPLTFIYTGSANYGNQWWGNKSYGGEVTGNDAITVGPRGSAEGANITLPNDPTVTVHVSLGSAAQPAAGATLTWERNYDEANSIGSASLRNSVVTDSRGNFSAVMAPGLYSLTYAPASSEFQRKTDRVVVDSAPVQISRTLPLSGTISGRVFLGSTAVPAGAGAVIIKHGDCATANSCTSAQITTTTDANGNFSFTGVPNGYYSLQYTYALGKQFQTVNSFNQEIVSDTAASFPGQDAILPPAATISGTVSLESAGTLAGAGAVTVEAWPQSNQGSFPASTAATNADGTYTLDGLPAGNYDLRFASAGSADYATAWWTASQDATHPYANVESEAADLRVGHSAVAGVNLTLPRAASVQGAVTRSNGAVLSSADFIYIHRLDVSGNVLDTTVTAQTDATGTYAITRMIPGRYSLQFVTTNDWTGLIDSYAGSTMADPGKTDTLDLPAGRVIVGENAVQFTNSGVTVTVPCPNCGTEDGTAYGVFTVVLQRLNPVSGEWLDLTPDAAMLPGFAWPRVLPGTYRAQATLNSDTSYQVHGRQFVVGEGQRSTQDLSVTNPTPIPAPTPTGAPVAWSGVPSSARNPIFHLDSATSSLGSIHLTGWAFSPTTDASIPVHVYVNGVGVAYTADVSRPDVDKTYGGSGDHGFSITIPQAAGGVKNIIVYAIAGTNPVIANLTLTLPGGSPFGLVDAVTTTATTITTSGWTIDQDSAQSIPVAIYVDNVGVRYLADGARSDVARGLPQYGLDHGFSETVAAAAGVHRVCTYAINVVGAGDNTLLGCTTVTVVNAATIGHLDQVRASAGMITISGWSVDPKTSASIHTDVYVDQSGVRLTASGNRPDVAAAYPGSGAAHGFSETVGAGVGIHTVCAYGINTLPGGANSLLGCKTVTVTDAAPIGAIDAVTGGKGAISIAGWTLDPDSASSIPVDIYVDTSGARYSANGNRPDIAAAFPGFGASHGYSQTIAATAGRHIVCAYGIDWGLGSTNTLLGCRTVTVR
jgi:hypothetical protein